MKRWELIRTVAGNYDEEKLRQRVIDSCEIIARISKNIVLGYYVNNIKELLLLQNQEKSTELLNTLLSKLSPKQYQTMLMVCQHDLMLNEDRLGAVGQAHLDVLTNKITSLIGNLRSYVQDTSSLGDSGSDAVITLSSGVTSHRPSNENVPSVTTAITTSLSGSLGFFQVLYDAYVNNIFMRNALEEYKKTIASLSLKRINDALTKSKEPQTQLTLIKQAAANDLCQKMFGQTLYSGFVYSITFGVLGSVFVPYIYAYVLGGIAVSMFVARRNSTRMYAKIQGFINNPDVDHQTVLVINNIDHIMQQRIDECLADNVTTFNRLAPYWMRFSALISAVILPYVPLISGAGSTINSLFTWRNTRAYIAAVYANPQSALHNALNIDEHTPLLFKYKGSNLIRSYIFKQIGLDRLQGYLRAADVPVKPENAYSLARRILSKLWLMENAKTKALLDALYDGSNPNAVNLLENIRAEAKHDELYKSLQQYIDQNRAKLDAYNTNLHTILSEHKMGNSTKFYALMHSYLNDAVKADVNYGVWITGLTIAIAWSLLLMASGALLLTGLNLEVAIASITLFITAMLTTYAINNRIEANLDSILQAISAEDFKTILDDNRMLHVLMLQDKINYNLANPATNSFATQSISRTCMVQAPWLYNYQFSLADEELFTQHKFARIFTDTVNYIPQDNAERLLILFCNLLNRSSMLQPIISNKQLRLRATGHALDVISVNPDNTEDKLIFTANTDTFNLNPATGLSKDEWQIYFAYMLIIGANLSIIDFSNQNASLAAQNFAAAIFAEFMAENYISCRLLFLCINSQTREAIYNLLQEKTLVVDGVLHDEYDMEMLRAHFGLMLTNDELRDINEVLYGMQHPFLHTRYMHNLEFLAADFYREAQLSTPTITEVIPNIAEQIYDALKRSVQFSIDTILGFDNNEIIVNLEDIGLESEDPEIDTCVKTCFKARFENLKQQLDALLTEHANLTKQNLDIAHATSQQALLHDQTIEHEKEKVAALENEYKILLSDLKKFQDAYQQVALGNNSALTNLAFDYCQQRRDVLQQETDAPVETQRRRASMLFSFQPTSPIAKERAAIDELLQVLPRYRDNS